MGTKTGHFGFVKAVARTDVGKRRKNNEDAFGVFHDKGVFCVADGMGGGDDGEIASAAVIKGLDEGLKALPYSPNGAYTAEDVVEVMEGSLTKASAWIFERTRKKKLSGCGSTFVGFALDATAPGKALAVHAGDSRLYVLHGRSIKQITHDHSVAELIGQKDEKKVNPMFRSMVMNAIGIRAKADPERTPFKVSPKDRVLVCSDGLTRMVPDKKILALSRKYEDVAAAADALIAAALQAGGIDNVTVVIIEIDNLPQGMPLLTPPVSENAEEFVTNGTDRDTDLTNGSSAESDFKTVDTLTPAISSEDMLAPEEVDETSSVAEEIASFRQTKSRRKMMWGVVALTIAASLVMLAVRMGIDFKRTQSKAFGSMLKTLVAPTKPVQMPPVPTSPSSSRLAPTSAPVVPLPKSNQKPICAQPKLMPSVAQTSFPSTIVSKTSSPVQQPKPTVTLVAPKSVPEVQTHVASRDAELVERVAKACSGSCVDLFCQGLRRLEGTTNHELAMQMKRLETSAHICSRMRTKEGALRAVVDLKYCLVSAERAHAELTKRKRAADRKLLTLWNALLDGDPTDATSMEGAAKILLLFSEECDR